MTCEHCGGELTCDAKMREALAGEKHLVAQLLDRAEAAEKARDGYKAAWENIVNLNQHGAIANVNRGVSELRRVHRLSIENNTYEAALKDIGSGDWDKTYCVLTARETLASVLARREMANKIVP